MQRNRSKAVADSRRCRAQKPCSRCAGPVPTRRPCAAALRRIEELLDE